MTSEEVIHFNVYCDESRHTSDPQNILIWYLGPSPAHVTLKGTLFITSIALNVNSWRKVNLDGNGYLPIAKYFICP